MITIAFTFETDIDPSLLIQLCDALFFEDVVDFKSSHHGLITLQKEQLPSLDMLLSTLMSLGIIGSLVVGYKDNLVLELARQLAFKTSKNKIMQLSDCLLLELILNQQSILNAFKQELSQLDHHHLLTVKAYLEAGLNASLAAEILYVHRNTFTYRLNQFIEKTNIDVREFHFAMLMAIGLNQDVVS